MLSIVLAMLAAAQAPAATAPATATPAQAAPAPKAKRKKQACATDEMELGSHIVMETCPDEYELLRRAHQAEQALQSSGVPVEKSAGPH